MTGGAQDEIQCLGPHTCPGWCGKSVDAREFCCQSCWFRLPPRIRILMWKSWDHMPLLVEQAVSDAKEFFDTDRPQGVDTDRSRG